MKDSKKCEKACITCLIICENCAINCNLIGDKNCYKFYSDFATICISCEKFKVENSDLNQDIPPFCSKVCKKCSCECEKHLSNYSSCEDCVAACKKQCEK